MSHLWKELHERAATFIGADDSEFIDNDWAKRIPSFGCRCTDFWIHWRPHNPPTFVSREAYFEWTVVLHNAVNAKLGKTQLTLDEARALWVPPPPAVSVDRGTALIEPTIEPIVEPIVEPIIEPIADSIVN